MFVKSTIVATSLALAAAAAYVQPRFQCGTGVPQCCNSLRDSQMADLAKVYMSVLPHIDGPDVSLNYLYDGMKHHFGFACTPVDRSGSCMGPMQPVCCQINAFDGLLAYGCNPATQY